MKNLKNETQKSFSTTNTDMIVLESMTKKRKKGGLKILIPWMPGGD
ncbi:MAG: hypothetical protein AAF489_08660 [Bacteroidota bacterium]